MTDRELQKLSRRDLLELLVQQEQQKEILEARVAQLEKLLDNHTIEIDKAGSIAEAALALNGVFESADRAAKQYVESIRRCSEQQEIIYSRIVSAAEQKAKAILADAEREKQRKMKEADDYCERINARLETLYKDHVGLRDYLANRAKKKTSENR